MAKAICDFDDIIRESRCLIVTTDNSTPLPSIIIEFEQ